ncbi:DUF2953 domain-containing protein [Calderihabitans maritimus]|nr:DUF2953 domain-containing protein [Calderihabitans maritimus]
MLFILLIVLSFLLLPLLPVYFDVRYRWQEKDERFQIKLYLWRGLVSRLEVPLLQWQGRNLSAIFRLKAGKDKEGKVLARRKVKVPWFKFPKVMSLSAPSVAFLWRIIQINRYLLGKVNCIRVRWVTEIGFNDPAVTGIAVGFLWGVKSYLYHHFRRVVKVDCVDPVIRVIPHFTGSRLQMDYHCIFAIRLGYIIIAGFKVIWSFIRLFFLKGVTGRAG